MTRSGLVPAAVAACTALATASCGLLPGGSPGGSSGPPRPSSAASAKPGDATGGHRYRRGILDVSNNGLLLDAHRIERYPSYSVLHIDLTTPPDHGTYSFDDQPWGGDFNDFKLLDPVNGKYYWPLRADDSDGMAFGSQATSDTADPFLEPGVRHPLMLYFPPVPAGVQGLTVLAPGTAGEMTGIPVMDGGKKQAAPPQASKTAPNSGQTFFYPVTPPSGKIWSQVDDLHDYVEGRSKTVSTGGGEQKIALRTDVLFAFDSAKLSSKATTVLDDAVEETRDKADPAKPPITITGFTDAKGSGAYNLKLSKRRADAVQKYVSAKLGGAYRYQATGKGEAAPVAPNSHDDGSDDPAGRARNRRVEIGYRIKQTTAPRTTTSSATPRPGAVGAPAAFRTSDGPTVGSVPIKNGMIDYGFDVHPFYRDGAYMVGVFDIRNHDSLDTGLTLDFDGKPVQKQMRGAGFRALVASDPVGKIDYYQERAGEFDGGSANFVNGDVLFPGNDVTYRQYVYYPAPPANVTRVNVKVGTFGTVRNVPVR